MGDNVQCSGCGKRYAVRPELAGKRTRCKACGTVIAIPRAESFDPFDPTSLAALEAAAGAEAQASPTARAGMRPQVRSASAAAPTLRKATAAVASMPPQFVNYGAPAYRADPFVEVPGAELIDRWGVWLPIMIFAAFLVMLGARAISSAFSMADAIGAPADKEARAVGYVVGRLCVLAAIPAVVFAPLCLLGVFIASKVMKFTNPNRLYLRCLAVVCAPLALIIAQNKFETDAGLLAVPWWVLVLTMAAFLWLLLRLKPIPFSVAAAPIWMNLTFGSPGSPRRTYAGNAPQPGAVGAPSSEVSTQRAEVEASLRKIGAAVNEYAAKNGGKYPRTLQELVSAGLLSNRDVESGRWHVNYRSIPWPDAPRSADFILADASSYFGDNGRPVLFGDGRVETIDIRALGDVENRSIAAFLAADGQAAAKARERRTAP